MLARLARFARPYIPRYVAGFLLLLATNGLALWIPWLLRDAIRAMEQRADLGVVAKLAGAMVGIAIAQAVVRTLSRLAILGAGRRVVFDVRNCFFSQLLRLGPSYYDSHRTGDVMSRGVNDVQLLQSLYGPGILNLLNTCIVYGGVIVLLVRLDAELTLVSLLLYPLLFFGVNRISRRVYARSLGVQEQLAAISNRSQENIGGIRQVQIYAQEEREIAAFRELCAEYRRRNLSMTVLRGALLALIGVTAGLGTLIVLFVGGRHVIEGRIGFGDFVAFNAYLGLLAWPTVALGWIINVFQRGLGAMQRVAEVLDSDPDIPPAVDEAGTADPNDISSVTGDIEIRGLTFAYADAAGRSEDAAAGAVLRDIDLTIPSGSRVALVGAVGAGKSTLVQLLARYYPVPPGTIFIGGRDITTIPLSQLRRSIGFAPQEAFLFSRSLRENIVLGRPAATESELERAVQLAHLAGDLEAFPDGLETPVGERGYTLSGGQRQRATLARAVVGEPRILILDDSLSSVDADTERAILAELADPDRRRTLILISHRLSTLSAIDRIVVLEAGRIVESGTHAELMERRGVYASLFQRHLLERRLAGP